jgi:hypothetical protein
MEGTCGCVERRWEGRDASGGVARGCGDWLELAVAVSGGQREGAKKGKLASCQLRPKSLVGKRLGPKRRPAVGHDPCEG